VFGRRGIEAFRIKRLDIRIKELRSLPPPVKVFSKMLEREDHVYLLESLVGPERLARYSFIGFAPRVILRSKNGNVHLESPESGDVATADSDPVTLLRRLVGPCSGSPVGFPFRGGAVGFISYDAVRMWENLPAIAQDDERFPDVEFGIYDDGLVFDHHDWEVFYYHHGEDRSDRILNAVNQSEDGEPFRCSDLRSAISQKRFEENVSRAKDYIAAGDIFQVVLSKRLDFKITGSLLAFYETLRKINPSPYMFYLKLGPRQIVGSSPEMLVRTADRVVETYPIAGTRPNVNDPAKNRTLANELLEDPKERAEHIMLVDLARNDLGRVCQYGSVSVPDFMEIHQFSHVQHIVSRVTGTLRDGYDAFDCLRAVFPAGTVSGAPKVRAMEIIDELEPTRRGPYAGAVGYVSYSGAADFAITIRTLVAEGDKASIQVGAGIVADSIPEREWTETENKAGALLAALTSCRSGGY
jgi:anthranilate synthase component 1